MWNWNDLFLESLAALNFWEWYVFGVNFLSLFISKNLNFQKSWKNGTANPYAPFLLLSIYPMLTFYHILISLSMSVHTCRCALHGPYAHFPKAMGLLLLLIFRIQSRDYTLHLAVLPLHVSCSLWRRLWTGQAVYFIEAHSGFIWWLLLYQILFIKLRCNWHITLY